MKTMGLAGFAFGVSTIVTFAQPICPPVIQWQKSFGTPSYEAATEIVQTSDGGFVIGGVGPYYPIPGGNKTSPNYGGRDFWIVRTDSDGNKLWDRSYGGNQDEFLDVVKQTSDGGFILGGTTWYDSSGGNKTSTNNGLSDFWVVRTDAAGNKLWDRSFGGEAYDFLLAIEPTADGGFVLAGSSSSQPGDGKSAPNIGDEDFWIVRLDAGGNRLWDRTYGGDGLDSARAIRQTADGGFIVAGITHGLFDDPVRGSFGGSDYWVVRLDANGNRIWDTLLGGLTRDDLLSMTLTSDGGCIVGGWSESPESGNKTSPLYGITDFWVVRLNAQGNKVWERAYGGADADMLESVSTTADGGFLFAGYSISGLTGTKTAPLIGAFDYWVIRTDANGNEVWQAAFGGSNSEFCRAAGQTADGGFILAGTSGSVDGDRHGRSFGSDDFWLVKLTPEGPNDCDHDGVPNAQDQCPGTVLGSLVNAQGCSVQQLCPCNVASHDEYLACVRETARAFQQAGLIDNARRHQLIETARAASCPPSSGPGELFVFGLPHRTINHAEFSLNPGWFDGVWIHPEEGTPGAFGVSIALGEANSGLFIYPDGNQSSYGEEWSLDVTAYGRHTGGSSDDVVSRVRVRKPFYESYPVDVDLAPLRPESVTVQVLSNRLVVAERTVPGSSANFHVGGYAYLQPRGNPYWRMPDGSVGVLVEFTNPSVFQQVLYYSISIGGEEDGFDGDQIFVRADNPRAGVQHISRVDAVGDGGLPGFEIRNERLGVFGHPHQALGAVAFNATRAALQVSTLEAIGPEDFAAVLIETPDDASRLEIDLKPVALPETGAGLALYPSGVIDADPIVFAALRVSRELDHLSFECDYQVLFDSASSNTPLVRIEALRNGRLTGSTILSNTAASGSLAFTDGRVPEIIGCRVTVNSNSIPTLGVSFARVTTFNGANGVQLTGNHIRITPLNPTYPVGSISTMSIEMVRFPLMTITGERSSLMPPVLSIQPAAGELVLTWTDSSHLYSLEAASSLSGPFTPVIAEIDTTSQENRLTVSISIQSTRFFRLAGPPD